MNSENNIKSKKVTLGETCRLVFVVFTLYLMGDAFYRWDGFKYYAYFSEFLSSVALITIMWSILSIVTAVCIWLLMKLSVSLPMCISKRISAEFLLLLICLLILSSEMVYLGKWYLSDVMLSNAMKKQMLLFILLGSITLAWFFRNRLDTIQERITPLVWLFGSIAILSVPLVIYSTFINDSDTRESKDVVQSYVSNESRPNIIFVVFDAMTARDMSVYGYNRETTPFINEWAKGGTVFTRLEAASNWTPPAVASIMSGKRVWTHRVYQPFGNEIVKGGTESLPLLLKQNGYYNMAYISNHYATTRKLGIDNAFDIDYPVSSFKLRKSVIEDVDSSLHSIFNGKIKLSNWLTQPDFIFAKIIGVILRQFHLAGDPSKLNRLPEIAFNKFLEDLNRNVRKPYFAWIHIYPPHDPYIPPEPYMGMFDSSSELRSAIGQDKLKAIQFKYRNKKMHGRLHEILPAMKTLRARYDEDIRYCDKQFEKFIEKLVENDKLKNTIIILSSDHGESFEHIKVGHGGPYLYEQLTHIPFILKLPGQTEGYTVNSLVEQIDISPTILDLANISVPSWMEGRTFKPFLRGERLPYRPVFSMNFESNPSRGEEIKNGVISIWEGDYKLIHYLGNGKSLVFNSNSLLFNLSEDPDETINLYEDNPKLGKRLLSLIQNNLEKANERIRVGLSTEGDN